MDIDNHHKAFCKRFNIPIANEVSAIKLWNSMGMSLLEVYPSSLDFSDRIDKIIHDFARNTGLSYPYINIAPMENFVISMNDFFQKSKYTNDVLLSKLLWWMQVFLILDSISNDDKKILSHYFSDALKIANVDAQIIVSGKEYIVCPKGAKELDKPLVNDILEWLDKYPQAKKGFASSLYNYMETVKSPTDENIMNAMNGLRVSLEQFLKEFHRKPTDTGWDKLFQATGAYLKGKDVAPQIRNIYSTLLNLFDAYQNNNAKHDFGAKANEIEFILYQTGSLMRFLIQLKHEEAEK